MKFVIGIGNPGREYDGTRHNVGFAVLDAIGRHAGATLVRPQTYVNRTGDAVRTLVGKNAAKPEDMLFVCDDVNLDFGKIRLREAGSAGGHHGLESVIEAIGGEGFARLRVGVRSEAMPRQLTGYVLEKFSKEEQMRLPDIVERAAQVCRAWIENGFEDARLTLSRLQSIQE